MMRKSKREREREREREEEREGTQGRIHILLKSPSFPNLPQATAQVIHFFVFFSMCSYT